VRDKILIVLEGVKTEPIYFKSLMKLYFPDFEGHIVCAFENNIYDLWAVIEQDPDLDIVEVVRERSEINRKALKNCRRSEISQTYLFFDLDGHDSKYEKRKVQELLSLFSNETESGSIFISYPMVESLRHFSSDYDFHNKKVGIFDGKYKNLVHIEGGKEYSQIHKVAIKEFNILIRQHIVKANYLCGRCPAVDINELFANKKIEYVNQELIFSSQLKFIEGDEEVSVLSGFPLFLHQYFGIDIFDRTCNLLLAKEEEILLSEICQSKEILGED
jgi:hypothetical protein